MGSMRRAFALSKDEVRNATPSGTAVLMNHDLVRTDTRPNGYITNDLQLVPEPSADPADPLNFPSWRKTSILLCMGLYAFITSISASVISSALPDLVTAFATYSDLGIPSGIETFANLTHLIAVNNLMLGASNIWWVPLGNTFGYRPTMLLCILILMASSVWCGKAASFNSLLAGRVVQGIGGGTADTLAPFIIGQAFFVHERGRAMAIYTFFLASGSLVGGLIGGYITDSLGWRWTCYIPAIMAGGLFVLVFFLVPETLFDRPRAMALSASANATQGNSPNRGSVDEKHRDQSTQYDQVDSINSHVFAPYTYSRSLSVGIYRPGLLKRIFTPYTTLLFPGTWMVMFHYAGLVGLIITISTVAPTLLEEPPYSWGANAGLINVGGLIGILLGGIYTYLLADWWITRTAKKESHGFGEPEARLPLAFPALIFAFAGPLIFGFCAAAGTSKAWIGLQFGYGMVAFALMQVPSIGFNYLIDSYGGWASDCFVMVVTFRAIISFAWTFFVGDWVDAVGYKLPFGIFALIMGLFGLFTVPVWLYGKRFRIAGDKYISKNFAVED